MINIKIDYETADRITIQTLTDYRDMLTEQLASGNMHEDDIDHTFKMIEAINFVVGDFANE